MTNSASPRRASRGDHRVASERERERERESIAASDKHRVRAYKRPMSAGQLARCPEGKRGGSETREKERETGKKAGKRDWNTDEEERVS